MSMEMSWLKDWLERLKYEAGLRVDKEDITKTILGRMKREWIDNVGYKVIDE